MARDVASCIGCGCDDFHACPDGCWWLRVDYKAARGVCSRCEEHLEAWDRGDRTPRAVSAAELEREEERALERVPSLPAPAPVLKPGERCPHYWPFFDVRDTDACRWCGMHFLRYAHTECP